MSNFSGRLYYDGDEGSILMNDFIPRADAVAFTLVSISSEGRWAAAGVAHQLANGRYRAEMVTAEQDGVNASPPWDVEFEYEQILDGLFVEGLIKDGPYTSTFSGDLLAKK